MGNLPGGAWIWTPDYRGGSADPKRCRQSVSDSGPWPRYHQCTRKAVVEEDGYGWCKQHAPSTCLARKAERKASWNAEWTAIERKSERDKIGVAIIAEAVKLAKQEGDYDKLIELAARYDALANPDPGA